MTAAEKWANFQPPAGFLPATSMVDGVELFGPGPEPAADGPIAVRCPSCGAGARFDPGRGAVACPFCDWIDATATREAGQAGAFTREALDRGAEGFGVDRRELGCGGCGAVIALEAGAMATSCPFCTSAQVAVREHATVRGLRPTAILPFAVPAERARAQAAAWLGAGWLHPADLHQVSQVDRFVGIYVPYWAFSAELSSTWEAEVGTEHTKTRRNGRGETETHTEIRWAWRRGEVRSSVHDLLVAGTTKLPARQLGRLEPGVRLDTAVGYEPRLLAGFQAQTYDVGLPEAWDRGRAEMRERARQACMRDTGSSHVRSFSMTADLGDETWRHVMVPLWVSVYRYGERTYAVLVHGATGEVAGQKPIAWWKVWTAVALLLSPGVALGLVGLPLLVVGLGAVVLIGAAVLLVVGGLVSAWLVHHANESEAP